ncbi:trans-aconitate 2-methyltransferase [Bradyrhizobium sp. WSM3983]|uniref:class I SAM-dependent methyltransferase n=1 Tax=Bradyrhizobium sp. WSM3983 TaxID=1038867 RepID=UPI0004111C97|nr:class I SAM-dependent methyltransferase [Bradyrhizobium sp. WSM3983]
MNKQSLVGSLSFHLQRALVVRSEFGLRELMVRLLRRLGLGGRELAAWQKRKMEADAEFDRKFGTDTGGVQNLADEHGIVGENAKHGLAHIASDPLQFRLIMDTLNLPVSEYTFVDLGCGKGRALLLAAQFPFKSIIGVDFVPSFVEAARTNVNIAASQGIRGDIEVVVGDATQFILPSGALLIYLYNPFDSRVVGKVARHLRESHQEDRRPLVVVYANPVHLSEFTSCGWQFMTKGSGWVALTRQS